MNPLEVQLKALVRFLNTTKTEYVILGGVAVALYGEPRLTFDIDVNVSIEVGKIDNFLKYAKKYGFYPAIPKIKSFIKKTGVIPVRFIKEKIEGRCDIIISESPLEAAAIKRGRLRKIGSLKARFVTPEDLIIHKIASDRPRDIEDVKGILIRQKRKLDMKYIYNWLRAIDRLYPKRKLVCLLDNFIKQL